MGPMQVMVFFFLCLSHISLAKVCPGCIITNDANNPAVYQYLSDKLKDFSSVAPKGMEGEERAELVHVKNVKEQVVSGIQYSYEFEAKGLNSHKLYDCSLVVLKQAWKGNEQIINYSCHPVVNKRSLLGGEVVLEVANNNNLDELKSVISQGIGESQNSKFLMKVTKFFKATEQIVEGSLIRTTVEVADTNCLQGEASKIDNCQIQDQNLQVCDVQVLLKPWLKVKEVTSVQCRPQPKFCAGCSVETNPSDVSVQQCLKRTLSNLNAQAHSSKKLSLIKINKVTSQVIAGVKYTIEFNATYENSKGDLSCKAVIISQPWISENPAVAEFNCTPSSSN